jgi:tRNA A-37 threonylcarbamoyl transferase component Bud32
VVTPTGGRQLGHFRLLHELGHGGMGVVYLAHDERLDRRVAIKTISEAIASTDEFRARFARETRIAIRLEHPNVVPVYEAGEIDGEMFIAMRFVDGLDLGKRLKQGSAIAPRALAEMAVMLGSALDAAHALGLVHRDIKPGNVLIANSGGLAHVYLTDFGLARETTSSEQDLTHTGQWMGTADYVSPEQLSGEPVTARSDVYSMSCLLFHALTGEVPFPGTLMAKLKAHSLDPLPSVGAAVAHAEAIDRVLARGTRKRPDERYLSAGDLARAFTLAVAGREAVVEEHEVATGIAHTGIDSTRPLHELVPPSSAADQRVTLRDSGRQPTRGTEHEVTVVEPRGRGELRARVAIGIAVAAGIAVGAGVLISGAGSGAGAGSSGGHRPSVTTGAVSPGSSGAVKPQRSFLLSIAGRADGSVWFVRKGAPHWSQTGRFVATGSPRMASGGSKTVIAARGAGNSTIWFAIVGTPGWVSTGPASIFRGADDPAVAVSPSGQITIADRGDDDTVWYVQPGLRGWRSTGGFHAVGNVSVGEGDGKVVLAARSASDGSIWEDVLGSAGWVSTGPASLFRGASDPAVTVSASGQVTIADRGDDNTVWYVQPGLAAWRGLGHFIAAGTPTLAAP